MALSTVGEALVTAAPRAAPAARTDVKCMVSEGAGESKGNGVNREEVGGRKRNEVVEEEGIRSKGMGEGIGFGEGMTRGGKGCEFS